MRQRGAGTRKIKEVDFGFSFGGAAIGPSNSAAVPLVPEPKEPSQPETAPTPAASPALKDSQGIGSVRRTPGSARNQLPQRPSTYDIPSDDGPAQLRSNKRRKISPPSQDDGSPSRPKTLRARKSISITAQNGDTGPATRNLLSASISATGPETTHDQTIREVNQGANGVEVDLTAASEPPQSGPTIPDRTRPSKVPIRKTQPAVDLAQPTRPSLEKSRKSGSPQQEESPAKRHSQKSTPPTIQEDDQAKTKGLRRRGELADGAEATQVQAPASDANAKKGQEDSELARDTATEAENDNQTTQRPSSRDGPKSKRGRPRNANSRSSPPQPAENVATEPEREPEQRNESVHATSQAPSEKKRPRGRPSLAKKTVDATVGDVIPEAESAARDEPENAPLEVPPKAKRLRGRPSLAMQTSEVPEIEGRPESSGMSKIAAGESSTTAARPGRKASKKRQKRPQPEPEPEMEPEVQASQELDPQPGADVQTETEAGPPKSRRGRPSKKAMRAGGSEAPPSEEQPDTDEPPEPRRKTREARGETVPVTVHRLANASALGAMYASGNGSSDEEEGSADELSTRQKTKLPNRGGVNPADVLSQICRETLEKTLNKLKVGIENETNNQKRAEWSRKRKAVEAFGLELDSRLLDLSEMLDSNFVLGMQLKKAKRDMMDLRSHLYKVRKERESIAIQMDAVRAKHMEEEKAKTARTTINNSLHTVELALDRSQHRAAPSTELSSADVEFMLRTVAEDVSCRAPGAQGGLLNQIRAFNNQLEATARRLEQS
ncbi:uncharacterized protein N7482_000834 [Penicillium canariense]|uniref:Inner kinetochore subunit AME1 domain-containing protein n=1 Tax=Penicillium canariense TaxID=189055 RepID=A0A9W9IEN9_9EURO|nr:uncharacterized protein N7482_000834 [Penicillium canariense]KAJ5174957.1 hypothetical protein N7482_000834 [Penicillium canariense]